MGIEKGSSRGALQDDDGAGAADAMESATQRKRAPKSPASLDGAVSPAHTATTASSTFSSDELNQDDAFGFDDDDDDDDLDAFLTEDDLHAAVAADKEKERASHNLRRTHKQKQKQKQKHKRRKQRLAAGRSGSVAWLLQTVRDACTPSSPWHLARVLLGLSFAWLLAALLWLRWPLYMQYIADPMTKALGDKLKAEVEPRVVVLALALPFAVTGVLYYALESRVSVPRTGSSANGPSATWLLWLRRQRRAYIHSSLDSVDVVAIAGFALVQLNCFVGKLLIDQYTGKLAKAGLLPRAARSFGMNGLYTMILSILLVSRQSFVHSYLQLSSERAARYHVWTGNVGLLALVLHGALYCVYWLERGELQAKLLPCVDCSSVEAYKTMRNFAGLVALASLFVVALASLEGVRRRHFRRFALVHCVNVLVVVFTCVHYYPAAFWFVPSVLVYVLYRVRARMGQGDATVLSAATLADKVVQLELRRDSSASLDFAPGQYVYLQVPEISRFAWHPFTIASSPLKHRHAFHIDAKVHGRFTQQLLALIKSHRLLRVKVDGYYGTPITTCAHMVFVAGGSGMTPFLSFLEHLQLETEALAPSSTRSATGVPKTLWVIWTCRDVELLDAHAELLHAINKSPHWQSKLWLHVTPAVRAGDDEVDDTDWDTCDDARVEKFVPASMHRHAYARDAALAHQLALFVGASVGLALAMHIVYTADATIGRVWWLKRVLLLGAGAFGAAAGCALVLLAFRVAAKCRRRDSDRGVGSAVTELEYAGEDLASPVTPQTPRKHMSGPGGATLLQRSFVVASTRPDVSQRLHSIHSEIQENFGMSADVGVFVSGPASLQTDAMRAASALHSPLVRVHQKSFTV